MSKPKFYFVMIGGAGDQVTGSCILICIVYNGKIHFGLIDYGIVQGKDADRNFNFPINAEKIEFVIVTHAHSDHFQGLPLLRGFTGKVYATSDTFTQGKELLRDGVKIYSQVAASEFGVSNDTYKAMLSELEDLRKRVNPNELQRYQALSTEVEELESCALFNQNDVDEIVKRFHNIRPYEEAKIDEDIYFRLIPSTHQNGAGSIELYVGDFGKYSVNISFSGDIGPNDSFLYKSHKYMPNHMINYCVLESLHGVEERVQSTEETYKELKKLIRKCIKDEKTLILNGFSLDRDTLLVYLINQISKEIDISVPVYFDTLLGYDELMHYQNSYASKENVWFKDLGEKPFDLTNIKVTNSYRKHMKAVQERGSKIIITASAFGEGGRVVDYFDHYIQDENAVFVFAGWISPECTSSVLHNAAEGKIVEIHGQNYVKHCKTIQFSGFSSHGYFTEYKEHIERFPNLNAIILNHADRDVKYALAEKLKENYSADIIIPEMYDAESHNFYLITSEAISEISSIDGHNVFKDVLK